MDRSTSLIYFVSEKTPKHSHAFIQTSRVFLYFLAVLQVQTHRQKHTHCQKVHLHFESQVSLLFWAPFQSQNNRKIHENCSNQTFKMCSRKLLVTPLANLIQKKSVKLFEIVKMYVHGANVHALVRGLQNRTRQTSMRLCAVRNELRQPVLKKNTVYRYLLRIFYRAESQHI
jgi:hypothetical protein